MTRMETRRVRRASKSMSTNRLDTPDRGTGRHESSSDANCQHGRHPGRRQRRSISEPHPRIQAAAAAARAADPAAHARGGVRRRHPDGDGRRSATRPTASARWSSAARPRGLAVSFALNPEWQLENGVSALAARAAVGQRPLRAADGRSRLRAAGAAAHAAARRRRRRVAARRRRASRDARTGRRGHQGPARRLAHRRHRQGPDRVRRARHRRVRVLAACCSTRSSTRGRTATRR